MKAIVTVTTSVLKMEVAVMLKLSNFYFF